MAAEGINDYKELRIYVDSQYNPSRLLILRAEDRDNSEVLMVNWRTFALAAYAIGLIVAGVYGYVVTTSAQVQNSSSLCSHPPTSTNLLPDCLPSLTLSETGSALMYPMFQSWVNNFTQLYPTVQMNIANTGSGTGQSFVEKGLVQIGGSAAYLSDDQQSRNPNILNIPLAVTSDLIEYNLFEPDGKTVFPSNIHLNFTAPLLSMIYNSTVIWWNDTRIKSINPGAANLIPSQRIWPVQRSDASGDTWMFTQYLAANDPWWSSNVGYGLQVTWPYCDPKICQVQSALGNPGIVIETGDIKYSISYVSVEALDKWVIGTYGLGTGLVQNRDENFLFPTLDNVKASIDALSPQTPADERFSLVNAPGPNSYPIVGYGYALVNKQQITPDFAAVLRAFLTYCLLPNYGNSPRFLDAYHFAPLPESIRQLSLNQVAVIGP